MRSLIEVEHLYKRFDDTVALDDVTFAVEEGTVLGLLGPNGAGKTTTIRILATLLAPDAGTARIDGVDAATDPDRVRSMIGLTGQYAAVDEKLTGFENLEMVARLLGCTKPAATARAAELLERFDLSHAGDRLVGTYSGGMRRRVDLAVSLVGRPTVLFLDEPTTGLDPPSRLQLWDIVNELVDGGTTLLLTTQYLEEADELADRIVVIDRGAVIADGTGIELKDRVGGRRLEIELFDRAQLDAAANLIRNRSAQLPHVDVASRRLSVPIGSDTDLATELIGSLRTASIVLEDFGFHRPTLDEVFLAVTGHTTDADDVTTGPAGAHRSHDPEGARS